jgi:DNA-binding NtrC family response regulator
MQNKPREAVVVIRDLIFETRIKSTGAALGVPVTVVRGAAELAGRLAGSTIGVVMVDLNTAGESAMDAIRAAAAAPSVRVVGFVSHVDVELAAGATQAGAHEVLPRSKFVERLADILSATGKI